MSPVVWAGISPMMLSYSEGLSRLPIQGTDRVNKSKTWLVLLLRPSLLSTEEMVCF